MLIVVETLLQMMMLLLLMVVLLRHCSVIGTDCSADDADAAAAASVDGHLRILDNKMTCNATMKAADSATVTTGCERGR
jgi:hypothetical protein